MLVKNVTYILLGCFVMAVAGCSATGTTSADKRASIERMHDRVLQDIYAVSPQARSHVASSPGYAVFSNAQINLFFLAGGGGHGVAKSGGRRVYMKMGEVGFGLGLGVKDFRALFVFHSASAYRDFVDKGLIFSGEADAAAKAADSGGQIGGGIPVGNMTLYQITESGLALQATLKGTKFWRDSELN
ncbi:lipid-binding SYLF domain-containing protein [Aliamphritea hakodatensis]|uniref:lipid-binding SYLF domain-containing protein n=1 Tax=Aliamphritea hakodatensis TaxID=2895352 RepID=UPI0022FD5C44|nr:hypothetical protein [Aliamphritea hakodatensis]